MEQIEAIRKPETLQQPKYDVVVVLGGNIRRTPNGFVSTNFEEGPEKSIGAHSRSRAAAELFNRGEAGFFIVSTGKTHPDPDAPSEAAVFKKEMMELGVPENAILEEETSLTTFQNAQEAIRIIRERNLKNIGVLSSSWHLRRSKAMFDRVADLEAEGRKIKLLSAEKILNDRSPHYKHLMKKVYGHDSMKARIAQEKQGVEDLKAGTYNPRPIEYTPEEKISR